MIRRVVLIAVILLCLLPAGLVFVEHWRGRAQLSATLSDLRARGESLDIDRVTPQPVPAASNGYTRFWTAASQLQATTEILPPVLEMVAPARAIPGLRLDRWPGPRGTTGSWEHVAAWVSEREDAFVDLHKALSQPLRMPERDYSRGFKLSLFGLAETKASVNALRVAALDAVHRGDLELALRHLRDMRQVDLDLGRLPLLIDHLIRLSCAAVLDAGVWEILHSREWAEPELAALQDALESTSLVEGALRAIEGERALGFTTLNSRGNLWQDLQAMGGTGAPLDLIVPSGLGDALPEEGLAARMLRGAQNHLLIPLWQTAWGDQALHHYLQDMQRILEVNREAARTHSYAPLKGFQSAAGRSPDSWFERLRALYSRHFVPSVERIVPRALRSETERALLRTEIAVRRFRLLHQRLPQSLADLVPDLLPATPIDGVDGQPLRYRLNDDGTFTLWSIGEDGTDDGGDPSWPPDQRGLRPWRFGRDTIWPLAASDEQIEAWLETEWNGRHRGRR